MNIHPTIFTVHNPFSLFLMHPLSTDPPKDTLYPILLPSCLYYLLPKRRFRHSYQGGICSYHALRYCF